MPTTNKLNDLRIKDIARRAAAIPPTKPIKYPDGGGLFLFGTPAGGLYWRMKYLIAGREKLLSIGQYPHVGLADARAARDEAKKLLAAGGDPSAVKIAARSAPAPRTDSFARFAEEVLAFHAPAQAPQTLAKWNLHLGYAIAEFGKRPIGEITPPEVLAFLERFKDRGHTLHSIKRKMSDVFARAAFAGACQGDPTHSLKAFLKPARDTNHPAVVSPERFGDVIRAIDGHAGHPSVRGALLFLALTFQRPHMVREMRWADVKWDKKRWEIPAAMMKGREGYALDHVVPLSAPALAVLRAMLPLTGEGELVFPGRDGEKPMSDNSMNKALRDRGISSDEHVAHGFRASANTMIKEHLKREVARALGGAAIDLQEIIDRQLAHVVGDQTRRAYDRVAQIEERTVLMDVWATFVEACRKRAKSRKLAVVA